MPVSLPKPPNRIARLPKDERGYPVPRFVEWFIEDLDGERRLARRTDLNAKPDFRIASAEYRAQAFKYGYCWVCGDQLGAHKVYAIGPMCVINRTTSEPACHRACAEYAVKACPFLLRPRMRRLPHADDVESRSPGGIMLERNPGCICLYETKEAKGFSDGIGSWLIRLGKPTKVDWWAEGRTATRSEIQASIDSGYPLLLAEAKKDGLQALGELARLTGAAMKLLPA